MKSEPSVTRLKPTRCSAVEIADSVDGMPSAWAAAIKTTQGRAPGAQETQKDLI